MNQLKITCTLFLLALVFPSAVAISYAAPTISSGDNQTFSQNQNSTLLRSITITEDSESTFITPESSIRITIPSDIATLFDTHRIKNEIQLAGTALEAGRVSQTPAVTFEDKEKTVVIPVHSAFAPGEQLIVNSLALEGFHAASSGSHFLSLNYSAKEPTVKDQFFLRISTSGLTDRISPGKITNATVTQLSPTSLKLIWQNPYDLDLYRIDLYHSEDAFTPGYFKEILLSEEFIHEDLKLGSTHNYQLIAKDNWNQSEASESVSITLNPDFTPPTVTEPIILPVDDSSTPNDLPAVDSSENASQLNTEAQNSFDSPQFPRVESSLTGPSFNDVPKSHSAYKAVEFLVNRKILKGRAPGLFDPAGTANRAELMKMIVLGFELELPEKIIRPSFPDTPKNEWFTPYTEAGFKNGILKGDKGRAEPGRTVTHAEGITMMMRAMGADLSSVASLPTTFTDVIAEDWFFQPVMFALANNIIQKKSSSYNPHSQLSRADLAIALYKAIKASGR